MTIYTWGYSRDRTLDDLLAALREAGWEDKTTPCLVDVRRSRRSRNPFWDLRDMPTVHPVATNGAPWGEHDTIGRLHGVRYVWVDGLGNQGKTCKWVRHPLWEQHFEMVVRAMPASPNIGQTQFAGPWVLICSEADHRRCHRTEVAEEVARRTGAPVLHL